ncbi:hypothetical protein [Tahibacter caeni]|uniref:hypothetical protein n=1 Tax=Tahibacter caeni TaxID=1453545 RepID=UPI002147A770|nr:hypothetical protein [Tahibacter caeni]
MRRLFLSLAALALTCLAAARPASALNLPWFEGVAKDIGSNFACLSDPPIFQIRVQAYAGYSLLPPNRTPAVGEVFYAHLVISHPGNPCGGSAMGIEMLLPPGVTPAISAENPAFCFARVPNGPRLINLANDSGYGCPQQLSQGLEGWAIRAPLNTQAGGAWLSFQGVWHEFLIPVVSDRIQNGTKLRFKVNPDIGVNGYPEALLFVNSDVLFRTSGEGNVLSLDVCTLTPIAQGCQ